MSITKQGNISLAKNPTYYSHTKHINVQYHFIHKKLDNEEIELKYYTIRDMVTNVLTKALTKERHQILIRAMELQRINYS